MVVLTSVLEGLKVSVRFGHEYLEVFKESYRDLLGFLWCAVRIVRVLQRADD